MGKRISRILTETTVRKALETIKESPERGIRNLIDLSIQFSAGEFQRDFLLMAQTMLQNQSSAYYKLIRNLVMYVDTEKIYTFGINLGYNGCSMGAQRIREYEEAMGFNIPWTVFLNIDTNRLEENRRRYDDLILEGERLGIYTWMLFASKLPEKTLSLVKTHSESAFCVFCEAKDISDAFVEEASGLENMMVAVRYDENAAAACERLCLNKMFYSAWYSCGADDVGHVVNGDIFESTQELAPFFTYIMPDRSCPAEALRSIYAAVKDIRVNQRYSTIAFDLAGDILAVDRFISRDSCSLMFDENGNARDWEKTYDNGDCNLFKSDLSNILFNIAPKKRAAL